MNPGDGSKQEPNPELELRIDLRISNLAARTSRPDPSSFSKLDGSIKKNTGFIKKLKAGITASQLDSLKKDLVSLKLEKYIEEIALTVADNLFKISGDILSAVELCSMLHQRFAGFTDLLVSTLVEQLGSPPGPVAGSVSEQKEKEETIRLTRQRSALRFVTELYLVGIAQDQPKQKECFIASILHNLVYYN